MVPHMSFTPCQVLERSIRLSWSIYWMTDNDAGTRPFAFAQQTRAAKDGGSRRDSLLDSANSTGCTISAVETTSGAGSPLSASQAERYFVLSVAIRRNTRTRPWIIVPSPHIRGFGLIRPGGRLVTPLSYTLSGEPRRLPSSQSAVPNAPD
jgi:hypothetical protein